MAQAFCNLQEFRHRADYDHLAAFSKASVLANISMATRAIQDLDNATKKDREAFLSLVAMFGK